MKCLGINLTKYMQDFCTEITAFSSHVSLVYFNTVELRWILWFRIYSHIFSVCHGSILLQYQNGIYYLFLCKKYPKLCFCSLQGLETCPGSAGARVFPFFLFFLFFLWNVGVRMWQHSWKEWKEYMPWLPSPLKKFQGSGLPSHKSPRACTLTNLWLGQIQQSDLHSWAVTSKWIGDTPHQGKGSLSPQCSHKGAGPLPLYSLPTPPCP